MIILGLPGHSPLGQDVRQLGVIGEVRPARVGVLPVIFTEDKTVIKIEMKADHSLVGCGLL